jgi:hypothetical protein
LKPIVTRALVVVAAALTLASCGSPAGPSPPPPPPPPPPNDPPRVESITLSASRVEVSQTVTVRATITDTETPVNLLSLTWQASTGTIVPDGTTARWSFPPNLQTPATPTLTLTVVETYGGGATQVRENRVTGTAPTLYVHNSPVEIEALVDDFLRKFTDSTVSPDEAVSEFSDSCEGKQEEWEDVQDDRENYVQLSATWSVDRIQLNASRTRAEVSATCRFRSRRKSDGVVGTVFGTCLLTSIYEDHRWWLCDSRFRPAPGSAFPTFRF